MLCCLPRQGACFCSQATSFCRATFENEAPALVSRKNLEMLCLTWNVNEQRPEGSPLFKWIADLSANASVAVIALQEIEMGGGSVAIAAAKDVLNKSAQVQLPSQGLVSLEGTCMLEQQLVPRHKPVLSMSAISLEETDVLGNQSRRG